LIPISLFETTLEVVSWISVPIDMHDDAQILALIKHLIGTKFVIPGCWADLMASCAISRSHLCAPNGRCVDVVFVPVGAHGVLTTFPSNHRDMLAWVHQ
jgi:hypothetical protein